MTLQNQRPPTPIASTPSATAQPVAAVSAQPTTPSKQKGARGSSFSTAEDEALVKSWIRTSEDAVIGSDQKGEVFFKAINEYYHTIKPAYCSRRNDKSTERRIKKILADCLSFAGCVAKVSSARPSGTNSDDELHLATALFNKLEITSMSDSCGPPFKFMSSYHLLKDHPKFDLIANREPTASPSPIPISPQPQEEALERSDTEEPEEAENGNKDSEEFKRPIGRKRMKSITSKAENDNKRLKIAEATLEAQKERNELLRSQQEMALFTSSADTSDPVVNEYMSIMRRRALDRLKASQTSSQVPETPHQSPTRDSQ